MIQRKTHRTATSINLGGPSGNAFVLLGLAKDLAGQLDLGYAAILAEMQTGDYAHLVAVFDRHFGEYVTLETENEKLLADLKEREQ